MIFIQIVRGFHYDRQDQFVKTFFNDILINLSLYSICILFLIIKQEATLFTKTT